MPLSFLAPHLPPFPSISTGFALGPSSLKVSGVSARPARLLPCSWCARNVNSASWPGAEGLPRAAVPWPSLAAPPGDPSVPPFLTPSLGSRAPRFSVRHPLVSYCIALQCLPHTP